MKKLAPHKKDLTPSVKITLLNYNSQNHEEYRKIFMAPLLNGFMKRQVLSSTE